MKYVVDASVVIKWFSIQSEPHIQEADRLVSLLGENKIILLAPDFLLLEISNVLMRAKGWSGEQVCAGIEKLYELGIHIIGFNIQILNESLAVAHKYRLSVYDALYIGLAKLEKAVLISDNSKHHGKITDGTVIMLEDFGE